MLWQRTLQHLLPMLTSEHGRGGERDKEGVEGGEGDK